MPRRKKRVLKINSLRGACTRIMRGSTINNNNKSSAISRSSQAIAISMRIPRNYKPEKWIIRKPSSNGTLQITKVLAKLVLPSVGNCSCTSINKWRMTSKKSYKF
ncbi:unnamed protein product [Trichogramma brassicae]|uniref:Uncharacterized protein n=1 Tax=Trichogramma brassicae TaxID=86971 RepID=A0A6H5IYJ2_9HYME|nr:unnamed protein product [Trichogramma brassicae]